MLDHRHSNSFLYVYNVEHRAIQGRTLTLLSYHIQHQFAPIGDPLIRLMYLFHFIVNHAAYYKKVPEGDWIHLLRTTQKPEQLSCSGFVYTVSQRI
ncbi:hypothetical protein L2089_21110 [Paenibacillus hunanensis]|uniref:hypothetical protein n=1 Tax=Paenibacillus hunanensis TaxID=539262 RepID=UPI0020268BA8|nr:hypothetical protein [Paenibacillus hunanensis]MCL9663188.1 hypothetical protein [Paenibacillus hunanensis]